MKFLRVGFVAATVVVLAGCGFGKPPVVAPDNSSEQGQSAPATESSDVVDSKDSDESSDIVDSASTKTESKDEAKSQDASGQYAEYFNGPKVKTSGFFSKPYDFSDGGYFFQAPSEVHRCAIFKKYVGCSSLNPPADAPDVYYPGNGDDKASGIKMSAGSKAKMIAITDTSFIRQDGTSQTVLQYGQVLDVEGFQCTTNMQEGVICRQGPHGFQFSSKKHTIW